MSSVGPSDSRESPDIPLSRLNKGKGRAISPRPADDASSPAARRPSRSPAASRAKRSTTLEDDERPSKRRRPSVVDVDDLPDDDEEEEEDEGLWAGIPDDVDPTALSIALQEAGADEEAMRRIGSDAGEPIELSDDSDDEPVVVRPPAVPTSPTAAAPDQASTSTAAAIPTADGPQPFTELVCPICLGPPCPLVITQCGHAHCGPCLHSALTAEKGEAGMLNGNCPVCRTVLKGGWGRSIRGATFRFGPIPS